METLYRLLDKLGLLDLETKARLELMVLRRIARDLKASSARLSTIRATQALKGINNDTYIRVTNCATGAMMAVGSLSIDIAQLRGEA